MAPRSDPLDHYKLDADQIGDSVIHYSYRSDRARGLRKVKVEERWDNVRTIGYGSFGEVWQQKRNDSNEHRAVKVLRKHQMKSCGIDYGREIEALAKFNAAQFRQEEVIVQFFGWWESEHSVHLAMEYFEMRDLSTFISEAKTSEQDAKDIAEDLLRALVMIHSQGFTHRDLKPQNIFVVQTSPRYWVKLGDFGISKRVSNLSTYLRTEVGTRAFSAPETTPDDYEETFQYTNAVDMWSLGCVIYNVLAHSLPYKNARAKSFPFPSQPLKDRVNDQGINLLECLLRVDPSTRWTAQKAVTHPWLHASGQGSSAAAEDTTENAGPVAQPKRSNESQDKSHRPADQLEMPNFISGMEKTCPKPADQTERPINQLTSQSSGFRGKKGAIDSSSNNDGRRKTTSNTLISPRYRISDSFEDPGTETLTPRRARYRLPKDASRGLHESGTTKKPTSSPVTPTIVSRPPRQMSELANTSASRDRTSSLDTTDPSWAGILGELKSMGITEDEIEENGDFIRDYIQQRKASEEPTYSPVTPTIVSRPSKIRLGMSSSSSYVVDKGTTQKETPVKVHHNALRMRRGQRLEKQAAEKMELFNTLRYLHRQEGPPDQIMIARALELIRNGVDLKMRSHGGTALHWAVRICCSKDAGHGIQILRELLESGADVEAQNDSGETALHTAVNFRIPSPTGNGIEVVRQLLRYKANVNAKGSVSRTPLHCSALLPWGEYIDVLLAAGARVNELDVVGMTALHRTAFNKGQGKNIARKLILAGTDINFIDRHGRTALDIAQQQGNSGVVEVIEEAQEQRRRSHGDRNTPSILEEDGNDPYSHAAMTERAEEILVNAKKRLTTMEGNLSRARGTLEKRPSSSM
ncbi:hypothetical protein JMJ35_004908 [Cladonia borealis]|uniref:Protein kinase domain-containing protein n=1 Tax=Cladonia borealis TaxID=184061 RepID=A0AA39UAY9_9LECA|nr:hypothetical protein JMJ35_004908 [Cladonia borealis]